MQNEIEQLKAELKALKCKVGTLIAEIEYDGEATKKTISECKKLIK